jgi:hypothetical protein
VRLTSSRHWTGRFASRPTVAAIARLLIAVLCAGSLFLAVRLL